MPVVPTAIANIESPAPGSHSQTRASWSTISHSRRLPPPQNQIITSYHTKGTDIQPRDNHIMQHLFPPVGLLGSRDFSVSETTSSKALATLELSLALASVKLQLKVRASCSPSSAGTCRSSGLRSLLFPTIAIGAHDSPCHETVSFVPGASSSLLREAYKVVQYLFNYDPHRIEGLSRGNRVYQHVSVDTNKVLRTHDAVFIL